MYRELIIGNESYKLRLTTKYSVQLEKALGYNPIEVFMALEEGKMPKLADMMIILHYMLQSLHHGITMDKTYDIYDDYVAEGNSMTDLIVVFMEVFQLSGYIPKGKTANGEEEVKN